MENEGKRSRGQAVFTFVLLFLLYFFDYADRTVVNSLFPFLKKDWGLTDAECGSLTSIVTFTIAAGTLPISVLIDRWSRTRVIGTMAVIWSLFTAACGFAGSFAQLFAARIGIGLGEAGYAPGGTAMI
ncbi:MAG TPA: MFS transporter, partial [Leptospiraceae bacterium]|nr:MFS transporter [Leptospiraceae bacterium]